MPSAQKTASQAASRIVSKALEVLVQKPLKTARAYAIRESLQGLWEQPE
jgi:hypothetical protein